MVKAIDLDHYRKFIDSIKIVRLKKGVSGAALSQRLGRADDYIARVESFDMELDVFAYVQLADELELDVKELIKLLNRE